MRYPLAERIGAPILEFCRETGALTRFCGIALARCFSLPLRRRLIVHQMVQIGVKSLPIATLTALFIGMVMVLQTGVWLAKFGARQYIPGIAFIALSREMVPAFTGVVVGARVAAAIAAELGTMKVTEQIDAMDILNIDPIRYLVVPRFWAAVFMLPLVSIYSMVTGLLGGMIVAAGGLHITPKQYFSITQKFANLNDFYSGIGKTFFFGAIIALVGCFYGFNTRGGAEGVGRSTTTSVVVTLVLVLVWDYILTSWTLAIFGSG